jgi:hypothetical protein
VNGSAGQELGERGPVPVYGFAQALTILERRYINWTTCHGLARLPGPTLSTNYKYDPHRRNATRKRRSAQILICGYAD